MPATAIKGKTSRRALGQLLRECPVCGHSELNYEFIIDGVPLCGCDRCKLSFLNPQPAGTTPPAGESNSEVYELRHAARIQQLIAYMGRVPETALIISSEAGIDADARSRGIAVTSLSIDELDRNALSDWPDQTFSACILCCSLERVSNPVEALRAIRRTLDPNGTLMAISPTLDSRMGRIFRSSWWEFRLENRYYFTADTLQCAVLKAGFGDPVMVRDESVVSLRYLRNKLTQLPSHLRYRFVRALLSLSPGPVRDRTFTFLHSRTVILARPKEIRATPLLSVIVPAYNEDATFPELMDKLLAKEIDGVDIEVIVIESNSTDSTRQQALQYQNHPRVRLLLQERARGKGNAVRAGLAAAAGDVVLIQDADLEYDIEDYDDLVKPILEHAQNFIIGSRHTTKTRVWKIREFNDAAGLAAFFNFGHLVFLTLLNVIYQQKLNDPFSMFKVFRRDCLYGLKFECDRFDFDFEIVIKLLRKGYRPVELPVNYRARSVSEGKKVRMFRDPVTWLKALVKFRNSRLYENVDLP
jgi:hypothetical protein